MCEQLGDEKIQAMADALAAGRKIEAIKLYREATGKGLKEAKDFIDALVPKLKEQDPEKYAALGETKSAGCAPTILVALAFVAATMWLVKSLV